MRLEKHLQDKNSITFRLAFPSTSCKGVRLLDATFGHSAESRKFGEFSRRAPPARSRRRFRRSRNSRVCAAPHEIYRTREYRARARLSLTGPSYYSLLSGSKPRAHGGSTIQGKPVTMCAYISSASRHHLPVASFSFFPFASPDRVLLRQVPADDGQTPSASPLPGHVILSSYSFSRPAA